MNPSQITQYSLPSDNCEVIIETSSSEEETSHSYNLRSSKYNNNSTWSIVDGNDASSGINFNSTKIL